MAKPPIKPQPETTGPGFDKYGMGMLSDGTIPTYTPEEAKQLIEQRDLEEADTSSDEIGDLDDFDKFFKK